MSDDMSNDVVIATTSPESSVTSTSAGTSVSSILTETHPDDIDVREKKQDKQSTEPPCAPEVYDLTIPGGVFAAEHIEAAEKQFKDIGLDNVAAQKLMDMAVKNQQQVLDQHLQQVQKWAEDVRTDNELGGINFNATVMHAKSGLKSFDESGDVYAILEQTGYANHPAVIKMLAKIGKSMGEDAFISGKDGHTNVPLEDRLFKNMKV